MPITLGNEAVYYGDDTIKDDSGNDSSIYPISSLFEENSQSFIVETIYFDDELTCFSNEAKASILRGLTQEGRHNLGSFAQYVD